VGERDGTVSGDRFIVEQLVRPMVNLYRVSTEVDGAAGAPVAFVRQKRLAAKEDIRFFTDEDETRELFRLRARRVIDLGGRYDVFAPDGSTIGVLERRFGESLLRTTWLVLDAAEQEILRAQERSMPIALLRRGWGLLPFVDVVPFPFPYHFSLLRDGQAVGGLERKVSLRDRYVLDLAGVGADTLDRRLAIALAVGLDALQDR
jgi:hypothetical protein